MSKKVASIKYFTDITNNYLIIQLLLTFKPTFFHFQFLAYVYYPIKVGFSNIMEGRDIQVDFDTLTSQTKTRLKVKISRTDKSGEPFANNVLNGLSKDPKTLSPKYFYDETGSQLFEQICELPEYYLTRTERTIIKRYSNEIARMSDRNSDLIELGSGSSSKTRLIIEAFLKHYSKLHYIPIDISKSIIVGSAKALLRRYSKLTITALVSDYLTALSALKQKNIHKKLILFLGSSIGNFDKKEAVNFLTKIHEAMNEQDLLLIGMDLLKDKNILVPAYDDAQGVTAKFNLNLLVRMNRELDADFDPSNFRHKAIFNEKESRIEMHIESTQTQTVTIGQIGRTFTFEKGETIHTENSYKFSKDEISDMAAECGFELQHAWYDDKSWFSLNLMKPV